MSDVRKKAKDLLKLAVGSKGEERDTALIQLDLLVDKYDLLSAGGKPINVAADLLEKLTSPDFMEGVANRAEKFASGLERVMAAGKRVSDRVAAERPSRGAGEPSRRRRYR